MAFPQVAAVSGGNNASDSKQHTVNLPNGIQSGDLLLVFFATDGYPTITFPGGWTQLFQTANSSYVAFGAWYRIADGEEGATITVETSTWEMSAHTSYRITGYSGTPEAGISATSNSSWPDPPSLTPTWGAEDTLWFACEGNDHQYSVSSYPTNYADGRNDIASSSSGCGVGTCRRELNAVSENPGTFTIAASEQWVANTVAIQPATMQEVAPSSIPSSESFGTPTVVPGAVTISPTSIASLEAFGTPIVSPGVVIISPSAIASLESFGTPIVTAGLTIFPSSIPSAESFGTPSLVYDQNISPSSIPSAESLGTPAILPGVVIISPSAIASLEAFGVPSILPGVVIISPSAIASLESFGIPYLVYGQTISPSAIASLEAFGEPVVILVTRYDQWTYWNVDAYAVSLCSYGAAVLAFRIDATDGHLYRCESSDNAENWGSWIDMGDVSGSVNSRLVACFKDADEAIVLYSIGGTLYRRRWNGSTWETAAAWSNSLSSITGIAVTYMGDWNVVITGVDGDGRAGVWTCVLGDGYSAAVDSWSALKDVMIAEAGAGISFSFPSLSMPDVFRMFFVETYSGSESYSRPYWSHSLATADFISNLWREPIPFNLDSDHGLSLCYKSPYAWLSRPARVWRASLTPPFVELTDSLLSVSSRIIPYRGGIEITLRNDDRRFNSLGSGTYEAVKKGSEILISWGYHTTSGKETGGFDPTTWIESWEYVTRGGQSQFILHSEDGWSILKRWRARRQFTWSQGSKNIYQLLALIFARAGLELSAFSTSTALVNQYPAFTINPGESGLTAVKRLLSMVPDVIFFVRDTAYLKNPTAADSSQYSYGTDHRILESNYLDRSATFNRVQVFGDGVFTEDWDWDEIALVYDRLIHVSDVNLDTTTLAHQRGQAIIDALGHDVSSKYWEYWESLVWPELAHQLGIATLREFEIEGLNGIILVPMNCGQDLFDVIAITSPQAGLNASKRRVISLTRTWTPNKPKSLYQMRVGLGAP